MIRPSTRFVASNGVRQRGRTTHSIRFSTGITLSGGAQPERRDTSVRDDARQNGCRTCQIKLDPWRRQELDPLTDEEMEESMQPLSRGDLLRREVMQTPDEVAAMLRLKGLGVHGTTGEVPIERFQRAEANALRSIAGIPPFAVSRELVRKVQADCAIEVDGNAYSVPWRLIGETVRVTLAGGQLRVSHAGHEVAVHQRCAGRFERRVDPLHFEGVVGFRSKAAVAAAPAPEIADPELLRPLLRRAAGRRALAMEHDHLVES